MEITPLAAVAPFQHKYRIRVRVTRIWRPKLYRTTTYDGLHFVLTDENGDSIHGRINEDQHTDMNPRPEVGQVYDVYHFSTQEDTYTPRVLQNQTVLYFSGATQFVKLDQTLPSIPQHSFRLIEFEDLEAERDNQVVLADIYGCIKVVKALHDQTLRTTNAVEKKCEITVHNLRREFLRITLWGDHAKSFDMEALQRSSPPVLAVFAALKLGEYDKRTVATNSNHTCVFFNPPLPMTDQYKIEFSKPGDRVEIIGNYQIAGELNQGDCVTVLELTALNPQQFMTKTVRCSAEILKFSENGWWYRSCPVYGCYIQLQKIEEEGNLYKCMKHQMQTPQPSSNNLLLWTVKDAFCWATLTLGGNQAEQLFNSTCGELLAKRKYPTEQSLPEEIAETVSQKHIFEIQIKLNHELVVKSISPDPVAAEPVTTTPAQPQPDRKRTSETSRRSLFSTDSEKKSRRQEEHTSSSTMQLEDKKDR